MPLELLRLAVLSTLFPVGSNCRPQQFYGLVVKLQTSAVLWSCCQTADLGSSMAALQCCDPVVPQTADFGSFLAALVWWQKPKKKYATQTASLGSLMVTLNSKSSNCRPQQFYGRFSVMWNFMSSNCRPWQFHGRFRVMTKRVHKTASPGSSCGTVLKLQTLAVSWSVYSDDLKCQSNCRPRQF